MERVIISLRIYLSPMMQFMCSVQVVVICVRGMLHFLVFDCPFSFVDGTGGRFDTLQHLPYQSLSHLEVLVVDCCF